MYAVSDFELIQKLGKETQRKFNAVFLVRHRETEILGVYKHILKNPKNEHLIPLLRQEAEISFTEKGLPQTLAFFEDETEIVLIRNFQEGIPLNEYWKNVKKTERIDFINLLIENLAPLFNVLEREGIVHCDIKPPNIIVHQQENHIEIGLIDFGMAIQKNKPVERKTLFALGYSAPELILNHLGLVNASTDIFSLGISIWQLFTGKLPLMHANPGIMTNLQITHPLPENGSIPREIRSILNKMCNKHSFQLPPNKMKEEEVNAFLKEAMNERFQNLEEVLESLALIHSSPKVFRKWLFRK